METHDTEKQFRIAFGQRLREAIEKSPFPYQKDFREAAGLSDGTLKNWLNGTFMPGVYDLQHISHILGVDMLWLGFGKGQMTSRNESLHQLLTRHIDIVATVFAEVRQFATQRGLSNETAAKMLIDYLDNELHTIQQKQVKAS